MKIYPYFRTNKGNMKNREDYRLKGGNITKFSKEFKSKTILTILKYNNKHSELSNIYNIFYAMLIRLKYSNIIKQ